MDMCVVNCPDGHINPYTGLYDLFKSFIEVLCAGAWFYVGYKVVKSVWAMVIASFWFLGTWNQTIDFLSGQAHEFTGTEKLLLLLTPVLLIFVFKLWKHRQIPL
jgi:hypothetical protein